MNQPSFLDYLTAIGTIATPILVLILTGVGWSIRNRNERVRELEEKLRDDRINVYFQILEPFIIAMLTDEIFKKDKSFKGKARQEIVDEKILSLEYRKAAYKLTLVGSDRVVKAYNDLMQAFYNKPENETSEETAMRLFHFLGKFLLEIRRGMGNEKTSLKEFEMLESMITDIRKYKNLLEGM